MKGPRSFVDRGGTFTDLVVLEGGRVRVDKVRSDEAVVGELAVGPLCFGTTVATNALLERRGVRTALVVTRGFADLVRIGDMARPQIFDPDALWPEPLCSAVFEVGGRIDEHGNELEPLEAGDLALDGFDAIAVVLLNSHRNPSHEAAVGAMLAKAPFVALGHEVSGETGYLARIETTLVDAAITPVLRASLHRDRIPGTALAMRSDGSLAPAPQLRAPDAVLSGPAGGVLAVAQVARQAGFRRAVGLDMGGTSTDVCQVDVERDLPRRTGDVRVAGVRVRRPMLEVETIAAGGGSILSSDGLSLFVGPSSAGADPGPQCYGRGGPPTVTDAALAMGLVDAQAFDPPLDVGRVQLPGDASAFLDVAREAMAAAVRRIASARGIDVRDHALVSYGGAAGQHAAAVAARLGIGTVLVHPCSAALSAWGQCLARREELAVAAIWQPLDACWVELRAVLDRLAAQLPDLGERRDSLDVRHAGTDHPVEVEVTAGASLDEVRRAFMCEHRARYGFDRPDHAIEVVNARVRTLAPSPEPPHSDPDPWNLGDHVATGPLRLSCPTTSVWVPAGWTARNHRGLLWIEQAQPTTKPESTARTPLGVALWGQRFMSVAEQAGETLRRLARSVNIRERLDFSCAVFDGSGRLVANAPHIPVHLGAMGETVRDLLQAIPDPPDDQAWVCNDPAAGGSHLPDLTVIRAVHAGGRRWFVASRGHHADVGGITAGSMPPHSEHLHQEGFVLRHEPLLHDGQLRDLGPLLVGCRQPQTVLADLEAQIASNATAARLLRELGPPATIDAWMAHLQDVADEAVHRLLARLPSGIAHDAIAGIPLVVRLHTDGERLHVDFTGTGGPHGGNLNAPGAVVRAAVLYTLRLLVAEPIPLNEGALRRVEIRVPADSLLDPPPHAAVAGGNVETSQRLVDLLLRAAGARAASAGTMNNLTLGGDGWAFYETIGGGQGASPAGPGASGRQVHMTNTRATDPEVLEARLPLRVRRFALRDEGGGAGTHSGGRGLVRELEVTAPAQAALLATRRDGGAPGLGTGEPGAPGRDEVRRGGRWAAWDGTEIALAPGDRVRVTTPGGGGWG